MFVLIWRTLFRLKSSPHPLLHCRSTNNSLSQFSQCFRRFSSLSRMFPSERVVFVGGCPTAATRFPWLYSKSVRKLPAVSTFTLNSRGVKWKVLFEKKNHVLFELFYLSLYLRTFSCVRSCFVINNCKWYSTEKLGYVLKITGKFADPIKVFLEWFTRANQWAVWTMDSP